MPAIRDPDAILKLRDGNREIAGLLVGEPEILLRDRKSRIHLDRLLQQVDGAAVLADEKIMPPLVAMLV